MFNPLTLVNLIVPLLMGITFGYLLRNKKVPKLEKLSLLVVVVLIFSLGFGIGSNNELLASLPKIGIQGFVISVLAVLFSVVFVKVGKKLVKMP